MIVLPVNIHKLQAVIHKCAALSMLSLVASVFNLGMEWRYKRKIKYPTKILAEVKVLSFILHYPVEDHSHFTANWLPSDKIIVNHIYT